MQTNLNCKTGKNPYFGMAIHSNDNVNKLIKSRIKNNKELEKLRQIINKQATNNEVDITLLTDGKNLCANVYPKEYIEENQKFCKRFSENFITKLFGGTVGFIEKAANYADKTANKITARKEMNIDNVLNNMK